MSNGQGGNVGVTPEQAERIARVMAGLSTPSRVRLLSRLRQGPCTVTALAAAVEMTQPAASHQLRILRDLELVVGRRDVRHIVYSLHDAQVAALLDETLRYAAHAVGPTPKPERGSPSRGSQASVGIAHAFAETRYFARG